MFRAMAIYLCSTGALESPSLPLSCCMGLILSYYPLESPSLPLSFFIITNNSIIANNHKHA